MAFSVPDEILPDEIWLKILGLLDVRSKGRMACVSSNFHRIITSYDDVLWSTVDLTQRPSDVIIIHGDRPNIHITPPAWSFPPSETQFLTLAHTYLGARLQELHLHVVNTHILKYLYDNCPNLETIRFPHDQMSLRNVNLTFMPSNVKSLDLCLKGCFQKSRSYRVCQFGAQPLQKLQVLTIRYTGFSPDLFSRLCNFHQLQELVLHQCSCLTLHGFNQIADEVPELKSLWFRYCVIRVDDMEFEYIIRMCTVKLRHLKKFKIQLSTKHIIPMEFDVLAGGLDSSTNFQSLWLDNMNFTTPEAGLKSLKELRELELVNCDSVDNEVVRSIGNNLQHLKHLSLKGCKNITDNSMSALSNLEFLEYLNVRDCKLTYKCICHTVIAMKSLYILHLTKDFSERYCKCVATLKERCPLLKVYDQDGLTSIS